MLDFARLQRSRTANDHLLAPAGLTTAAVDGPAPEFELDPDRLIAAFRAMARAQPRTVETGFDAALRQAACVQRSKLFRFPDTVTARAVELAPGRAALAIYSRSRYGRRDFGVNRNRVEDWLRQLRAAVAALS